MEDIFQILFFVAFAVLGIVPQIVKRKKEKGAQPQPFSPEEEWEETFDNWEEKEIHPQPIVKQAAKPQKRVFNSVKTHPQSSQATTLQSSSSKSGKKIKLSSKKEAKRAFIYSEIFNRKYT